jgi:chromosomal replication initiator protein
VERDPRDAVAGLQVNEWMRISNFLRGRINAHSYETWIRPLRYHAITDRKLIVRVPTEDFLHVADKYKDELVDAISALLLDSIDEVKFAVNYVRSTPDVSLEPLVADGRSSNVNNRPSSSLNPKYSLGAYIVGAGNQFAVAAAKAVAERSAANYNPLFVYGSKGVGKTHLLHGIGLNASLHRPGATVRYTTAQGFANEMIQSLRSGKTEGFRANFRNSQVLLFDDIQALIGKKRTQEEFLNTFDSVLQAGGQIVVTADRAPKALSELDERLRSRIEGGLTVDIQPPDLETRVAILKLKADTGHISLPDETAMYIASSVNTNVRELEGAFIRLAMWCEIQRQDLTVDVARQCLTQLLGTQKRRIKIDHIQHAVAKEFRIDVGFLKENTSRSSVLPRQVAMFLAQQLTEASSPEIGRHFGGRHHTTVLHASAKIKQLIKTDDKLEKSVKRVIDSLQYLGR